MAVQGTVMHYQALTVPHTEHKIADAYRRQISAAYLSWTEVQRDKLGFPMSISTRLALHLLGS